MKHVKTINEYLNPILPISRDKLGMGIKADDELIINSKLYHFWYFDDEKNEIHAVDESGEDHTFNLDEINNTWEISGINDHEIVVENKK
jgi:autonomous glycyl radical cofactor GrcA